MRRRILNLLICISLLIGAATAILWVRSCRHGDCVYGGTYDGTCYRYWFITSTCGRLSTGKYCNPTDAPECGLRSVR